MRVIIVILYNILAKNKFDTYYSADFVKDQLKKQVAHYHQHRTDGYRKPHSIHKTSYVTKQIQKFIHISDGQIEFMI